MALAQQIRMKVRGVTLDIHRCKKTIYLIKYEKFMREEE